jgi:hypothetical protein
MAISLGRLKRKWLKVLTTAVNIGMASCQCPLTIFWTAGARSFERVSFFSSVILLSSRSYAARLVRPFFGAFAGSNTTRIRIPVAFANRSNVDRLGFAAPLSNRAIVDCEVPIFFASSACDSFARVRASISKLATANSGANAS